MNQRTSKGGAVKAASNIYSNHQAELADLVEMWRLYAKQSGNPEVESVYDQFNNLAYALSMASSRSTMQGPDGVAKVAVLGVNLLNESGANWIETVERNLSALQSEILYSGNMVITQALESGKDWAAKQADIPYTGHPAKVANANLTACDLLAGTAKFLFGEPLNPNDGLEGELKSAGLLQETRQKAHSR